MWFAHFLIDYILIVSGLFYYTESSLKKYKGTLYLIVIMIPLVVFSSLRYPKGDTYIYLDVFGQLSEGASIQDFPLFEPGFLLFTKLISNITNNEQIYLFIISVVFFLLIFRFIRKYSVLIWLSVFLLVGLELYDQSMNIVRQILAVSIIANSYESLKNKKYVYFSILVLFASMFHFTALIFFGAIVADKIKLTNRKFLLYIILLLVAMPLSAKILTFIMSKMNIYAQYLESETFAIVDTPKLACILHLGISFLIACGTYVWGLKADNPILRDNNERMLKLSMVGSLFWALSMNFATIGRLAIYFDVFSVVLIPNVLYSIHRKENRHILIIMVLMLFITKYFVISYLRPDWYSVYPYRFYFN